jgi:excisionase family DNA binding protein
VPKLLSLQEAADELGVHYMTAYRYVRTGRLPAVKDGAQWWVRPAELSRFAAAQAKAPPRRRGGRRTDYASRLVEPLVHGDELGAWTIVQGALASGIGLDELYLTVLGPAMREIGDRWAAGRVSVAMEHSATAVMHRLIGRLGPGMRRRGRTKGTVVVGAPAGDMHALPVALFADLLRAQGISVIDLGANVPPTSFVEEVRAADRLLGVAITVSSGDRHAVRKIVVAVRNATAAPIVLGGVGSSTKMARDVGADRYFHDTVDALDFFATASQA